MSKRGTKRAMSVRGDEASTSKRRRPEPEDALWQIRSVSDLKMSSIYNRSASEAPAELFRKDLISAMKLPDSEPLTSNEYWVITDTWKQDWERGVQVPVNPDSLPAPVVNVIDNPLPPNFHEFKLPREKYIHLNRDAHYQSDRHHLSTTAARAEAACTYDLDAIDTSWLKLLNAERARAGTPSVTEDQLEKVIEELEVRCWDKIQSIMKSEEKLGIEYDENVICDVCRSPDSEEGNEMVFCDSCNICVHQACYGITAIPSGQWLCRPCGDGTRPMCVLCPNLGGAMKCTPSGHKWAHVSCVLWIPEVSIGCAEKMEPITKISAIPASRWSLVCVLCRERKGACIQCSVKTCKTAYHVTCAFKHGLEMRAIIEDENADDGVKLRSYCQKHSVNSKKDKDKCPGSGSDEEEVKRKRRKEMTSEEKNQARALKLHEIESEFDRHVNVKDISTHLLDVDQDAIYYIYNYWKLKRRAGHNRPLLPPKADDNDLLSHRQEQADLDKMKMFVQLRQDLERVRNLCYMVSRREKLSRSFFRLREQTFHKQVAVLSTDVDLSGPALTAIVEANHGPSIYDRLYSHPGAPDHKNDFDTLLSRIAGFSDSCDEKKKELNGLIKSSKSATNPYKKVYVNGSSRRSGSMYSGLSSEESAPEIHRSGSKYRNRTLGSSTEEDTKPVNLPKKKKASVSKDKSPIKKPDKKKRLQPSRTVIDSSSEEDFKPKTKKDKTCASTTLRQMEKEMAAVQSGTESDDFMPVVRLSRNNKFPVDIYSDSSDNGSLNKTEGHNTDRSPNATNDSQQQLPRTKAAMKEFVPMHKTTKDDPITKKRGRKPSTYRDNTQDSDEDAKNKENIKSSKKKECPSDLIVPQRQAAKKASENMRSTTIAKIKDTDIPDKSINTTEEPKAKIRPKLKNKESKEKDSPVKESSKSKLSTDSLDMEKDDKELIAYVPQRQAAKKAAAHIKSGLGSKFPIAESSDEKKKDDEKSNTIKKSPKKEDDKHSRISSKTSSSSSSNSSSSSCTSSSSSEAEDVKVEKTEKVEKIEKTEKIESKVTKSREMKPQTAKQATLFSPPRSRPTVDLPFLDKVSRPLSSTSASSDTDSSKDSSGSSPTRKRIRPRRKDSCSVPDSQSRKAPDKKLKTSERRPEFGDPAPTAQGEESGGTSETRCAPRTRTRSIAAGGNMPHKHDSRSREPSRGESDYFHTKTKTSKENVQSSELSVKERKEDEALSKKPKHESHKQDTTRIDEKPSRKPYRLSTDKKVADNVEKVQVSPSKSTELKHKTPFNRRLSVKESITPIDEGLPAAIENKANKYNIHNTTDSYNKHLSPTKITSTLDKPFSIEKKSSSPEKVIGSGLSDTSKHWFPKAHSPNMQLPSIEKLGGNDKYMSEDKAFDSDSADKSSVKMIAKIQATLNENTMIKSPKTPMDARTVNIEPIDVDMPMPSNVRKRPTLESEKKFVTQDASHVQGVEISKSAKIPSTVNTFNRCMFSPQPKDNELFELDMLSVEDGFNHEDIIKPFTYPEFFFKEDSKEDRGVQETLNLVEKLRMTLSSKKPPQTENTTQDETVSSNDKNTSQQSDNAATCLQNNIDVALTSKNTALDYTEKKPHEKDTLNLTMNHLPQHEPEVINDLPPENRPPLSLMSNAMKWSDVPLQGNSRAVDQLNTDYSRKEYNASLHYNEDTFKDSESTGQRTQPASEPDRDTISKQSDDSQSLSVVDHSIDQESMTNDNQNFENNNSMIHSDCATISSPYVDSQDSKWRESKITHRRSSASSTNSDASMCSQKTDMKVQVNSCDSHQANIMPDIDTYPPIPPYCPLEPLPLSQYNAYPPETSQYLSVMSPISIFPPGVCGPSQMSLTSPGAGLFSPYCAPPLMPPLPKPAGFPLSAAFTSSSQNIALTTAMIAPPTPKPVEQSPRDDIDMGSDKYSLHPTPSPTVSVDSYNETSSNRQILPKHSSESCEPIVVAQPPSEPKSPPKPLKTTTKFISQHMKSPGKSPGISPKQNKDTTASKRATNKNNRGQRGRGRSKSRAHAYPHANVDYLGNSIQSKLVGTVYDFDEEIANDGVDLKALRERRKSVDVHERKSENSYKDASQSPHVSSPSHQNKRAPPIPENKEVKTPAPTTDTQAARGSSSSPKTPTERQQSFQPVVQPVLPGPVDMRTYQPFETPANTGEQYHSHLLAFASGTADQQLADIDEEIEKQLHSALAASKPTVSPKVAGGDPSQPAIKIPIVDKPAVEVPLPKVSLSDSRNQLKVKIKGPFLDANYSTSSVQPVAPQPPIPTLEPPTNILGPPSAVGSAMMSGTTNLRRMRKKELLRQYWTQDMNMDEPTNNSSMGTVPPPSTQPLLSRAVITIPKAVASMTSIPTREDYRSISDANVDKKKRRATTGVSRELRHLEVSMNDDVDNSDDTRLSNYSSTAVQMFSQKRKGRISNKPAKPASSPQLTPKLKIKIGSGFVQPMTVEEMPNFQFRPPKKRLASIQKPSIEDLRRESMKYRRMVMANFEEDEKTKKHKPKSEKRKKKKDKKKLQVVNNDSESATKLVIKIKRAKDSAGSKESAEAASGSRAGHASAGEAPVAPVAPVPPADPFEYDPTAPDPLAIDPPSYAEASSALRKIRTAKVSPIRLKLARSAEGSGYVMKEPGGPAEANASPAQPLQLAVNKHCEVR